MTGWGLEVFTYYNHWWVVPIVATHVGAIIGAWLYYLAVGGWAGRQPAHPEPRDQLAEGG
jgi:hypothetical protein